MVSKNSLDSPCSCWQGYAPGSAQARETEACWSEMGGGVDTGCLQGAVAGICVAVLSSDQALCGATREVGDFCPLKPATSIENKTKGQRTARKLKNCQNKVNLFPSLSRSLPTAKQRHLHPNPSRQCAETWSVGSQDYPQGKQLHSAVHHVLYHLHHWEVSPVCCCLDSLWHPSDTQEFSN